MALNMERFFYYAALFERLEVDRVFIVDARDLLFQGDPFSNWKADLEVFCEDPSVTIGSCPYNSMWVGRKYGPEKLAQLADKPIICAGTTRGTRAAMLNYCRLMCDEIENDATGLNIDQGAHNRLVYDGLLDPVCITPNKQGCVQTVGNQQTFVFDRQGRLLNDDGRPCPVVHQFDRHPVFFNLLGVKSDYVQ